MKSIFNFQKSFRISIETSFLLWNYRSLLLEQAKRDLFDNHVGQIAGGIWLFLHPIFLMLVYVTIFGIVFKNKIGGTYELPLDYTAYILSGLICWLTTNQVLAKSISALVANRNLIKQVVFPIEVLPVKVVLATFLPFLVMIFIFVIYVSITHGKLSNSYVFIPLLILIQFLWAVGIGFFLASLSVFVKDTKEIVSMFSVVGMFLSPIVYLPEWIPDAFSTVIYVNPFSYLIWCYQDVLYFGRIEHPTAWIVTITLAFLLYLGGMRFFRKLKPYFGDVL